MYEFGLEIRRLTVTLMYLNSKVDSKALSIFECNLAVQ